MLFFTTSLLLSVILMTSGASVSENEEEVENDVANSPPLSEQIILYDVISDAPLDDVVASSSIRYAFQVLGTSRYFVVAVDDGSDALGQLSFPQGSSVTQLPVEPLVDYLKLIGGTLEGEEPSNPATFDDEDLLVLIREFPSPETATQNDFVVRMRTYLDTFSGARDSVQDASYSAIARYPPRFYYFMNINENGLQRALLDGLDSAGGPGNVNISILRLRQL